MSGKRSQCARGIQARVAPVVVVVGAGQDLERPLLVGRHQRELGLPAPDRHPLEPVRERRRAGLSAGATNGRGVERGLGIVRRVPERPREEPKLERAAVAHGALVARRRRSCWAPSSRALRATSAAIAVWVQPDHDVPNEPTVPFAHCCRLIQAMVSAPSSASGTRKFTSPSERKQPRQSWLTTT